MSIKPGSPKKRSNYKEHVSMTIPISIKPKDLQRILGISYSQAKRKVKAIREVNGKQRHQCVTIPETADFLGLPEEIIKKTLENTK